MNNLRFKKSVMRNLKVRDLFMYENGAVVYVFEGYNDGRYWYTEYESFYQHRVRKAYSTDKNANVNRVNESGI